MKLRLVLCAALVAAVAVVPSASARPQQAHREQASQGIATGVATAVAAEIVKSGIKAGVAKWAPDLTKHVDPTAYGLAQIQEQLAQIDAKLTQLIDHQVGLEEHLNCVIQRQSVAPVVARTQAAFERMLDMARLSSTSSRARVLDEIYAQHGMLTADQNQLHQALVGSDSLITACARHIEAGMRPYLSSMLAQHVRDFYAVYNATAAELLVLRVTAIAWHPDAFPEGKAQEIARVQEQRVAAEEALIRPAFPSSESYDKRINWLWKVKTVPQTPSSLWETLQNTQGWYVTGHKTIPTCSAVMAFAEAGGLSGSSAVAYLRQENILDLPPLNNILCYDDHDRLHDFDMARYRYHYAGDYTSTSESVAARPNEGAGAVDWRKYSYLGS